MQSHIFFVQKYKQNSLFYLQLCFSSRWDLQIVTPRYIITKIIISMTKLLDADWLRGVQLFH